ncbi:MAG: ABC transporter permease [Thermoanaerobaculia bacterium]
MGALMQDLKYALRTLAKSPGFTLTAVATLALGIGANTAIFSVIQGVLLAPLPYPDATRLAALEVNLSAPELSDLRAGTRSFAAMGGASPMTFDLTGVGEPLKLEAALVAGELFEALGARAALGRPLAKSDDIPGGERVVALSYGFWQTQFAGDREVLGRSITLGGVPWTVAGVLAPAFRLPDIPADVYTPIEVAYPLAAQARGAHMLRAVLRLAPGVSPAAARGDLDAVMKRLAVAHPDEDKYLRPDFVPLLEGIVGESKRPLWILAGAVGLVLLIACANLANLLLARAASRRAELAVRTALGASRGRLMGQILIESLVLAAVGGACGILLASWGTQLLLAAMPDSLPRLEGVGIDGRVVAFTGVLSLLTGVAFGILPAWKASSRRFAPGLSGPRGQAGLSAGRLRNAFVVAEIAVAMVLLVAAGLLLHALWRLNSVRPGFAAEGRVAARLDLPESRYSEIPVQTRFRERVLAELNAAPGVSAAMISEVPLTGQALNHNFLIEGRPPISIGDEPELYSRSVMGDYFGVMGISRKAGRDLSPSDRDGAPLVGVVNESFARQYFPGASPVGARMRWARDEEVHWIEIVGVVGDVRHFGLAHGDEPAVYTPYAQSSQAWKRWMEVVVRGPREAKGTAGLAALLREKVHAVDPLIPVPGARSLDSIVTSSLGSERFRTRLLTLFAGLALLLASVGIAGVMSQSVRQRTAEIGVRMALGAEPRRVVGGLLAEGMKLTALGLLIGVGGALAASRVLSSFLYGIGATDPATYAAVALLLAACAALACWIPARRAASIDPMRALRAE